MDHYATLGIDKTATPDEIKSAYRRLASKHHPDKGGDTAQFQRIEAAYRVLSDPQQRQAYDNPPTANWGPFNAGQNPFEDFINQFTRQQRQRVYTIHLNVTLEQIASGSHETIRVQTAAGPQLFQIRVPRGIENGQQFRYDGLMPDGAVVITFHVVPHPIFMRDGLHLVMYHSVNTLHLIAGTSIIVRTVSGQELSVTIPPMTNPGKKFRIPGRGLQDENGNTGDQYVLIQTHLPDTISDELKQSILREIGVNTT